MLIAFLSLVYLYSILFILHFKLLNIIKSHISSNRYVAFYLSWQLYFGGDFMSKGKRGIIIQMMNGEIFVNTSGFYVYYKYAFWFIKINPKLLFPGFQREHCKNIYVNERKVGYAEHRNGCVPLKDYDYTKGGMLNKPINFIRRKLGLLCKPHNRGYYLIKIKNNTYILLSRITPQNNVFCQLFDGPTGYLISNFTFDNTITRVYPHVISPDFLEVMFIVIGYVAEVTVYTSAVSNLDRKIEVIFK